MLRGIITLLTTSTVALHALLGCCAHHSHAIDLHGGHAHASMVIVNSLVEVDCDKHKHVAHNDEHAGLTHSLGKDDDEHRGDENHKNHQGCDFIDCSYTLSDRGHDLERSMAYSLLSQSITDGRLLMESLQRLLNSQTVDESLTFPLALSSTSRAFTQVWLL